jgi:hypothetical protein
MESVTVLLNFFDELCAAKFRIERLRRQLDKVGFH